MRFIAGQPLPFASAFQPAPGLGYYQAAPAACYAAPGLGQPAYQDPNCFVNCRNSTCYSDWSACEVQGDDAACDRWVACSNRCTDQCTPPARAATPTPPAAEPTGEISLFKLLGWT